MASLENLALPQCYIYISTLEGEKIWRLPNYPDTINDNMQSTFASTNALSRSAPVFTYSNSGPRSVQVSFRLIRDMMDEINIGVSNVVLEDGEDYVDALLARLQSIALPKYNLNNKAVEPPVVAVRLGNDIFIKGIVNGGIAVTYNKPILNNDKYSVVDVAFTVYEIDPYDATTVAKNGGFRGLTKTMKKGFGLEKE